MAEHDFLNLDDEQKLLLATHCTVAFSCLTRADLEAVYAGLAETNRLFGPHGVTFYLFQMAHRAMTMDQVNGKRAHLRFGTPDGRLYTTDGIDENVLGEDQAEVVGDALRIGRFVEAAGAREMQTCIDLFYEASLLDQPRLTAFMQGVLQVASQIVQGNLAMQDRQRANLN